MLPLASLDSRHTLDKFLADICETDPQNEMTRIQQSKGSLLRECHSWIIQSLELETWQTCNDPRLLWMKGGPGKGKTMAMISLVDMLTDQIKVDCRGSLCYFFCQTSIPHLNNAASVLRALIWKLLWTNNNLHKYIPDEYKCKRDQGREVFDSPNAVAMLTTMLSAMLRDTTLGTVFVLIDAVDECDNGMHDFLEWVIDQSSDPSSRAKWLLSSRHSPEIEDYLRPGSHKICLSLDSSEACMSDSVNYFIEHRVRQIAKRKSFSFADQKAIETTLKEKAESTFLWVALVCQRLQATSRRRIKRELEELPSGLGPLYDRMLRRLEDLTDEDDKYLCKKILRVVIIGLRPLSLGELRVVAGLQNNAMNDITQLVELCSSFLVTRGDNVFVVHQSAKDYFCAGGGQRLFANGVANEHNAIFQRLLDIMESRLTRNIYNLQHLGCSTEEIERPQPDPLAPLQYPITYWVAHLSLYVCQSASNLQVYAGSHDEGRIDNFLKKHFLHWLEALSLIGHLTHSIRMIKNLEDLLKVKAMIFS